MIKKFFLITICFCFLTELSVYADDFHKYVKLLPTNNIKSYNFEDLNNRMSLKIQIIEDVSTKNKLIEGQKLLFLTKEDTVLTHKKILPAGSRVFGTIETVSKNDKVGIPADLIVGNFKIEYMPAIKLEGSIKKQGANRTIWVRFLKPILFPIKGGQAKIKSTETFEVFFTPELL